MTMKGSCLCGTVSFEVKKLSGPFEICHCSRCRKLSGAQGMPAVGADPADFTLLTGADNIETYAAPIIHRPPAYHSYFCKTCGSPVPLAGEGDTFMEIPAGLFDDDISIQPDKHIFVEHLPDWDHISDGRPEMTMIDLIEWRKQQS